MPIEDETVAVGAAQAHDGDKSLCFASVDDAHGRRERMKVWSGSGEVTV